MSKNQLGGGEGSEGGGQTMPTEPMLKGVSNGHKENRGRKKCNQDNKKRCQNLRRKKFQQKGKNRVKKPLV